jgi:hypothetical protein
LLRKRKRAFPELETLLYTPFSELGNALGYSFSFGAIQQNASIAKRAILC